MPEMFGPRTAVPSLRDKSHESLAFSPAVVYHRAAHDPDSSDPQYRVFASLVELAVDAVCASDSGLHFFASFDPETNRASVSFPLAFPGGIDRTIVRSRFVLLACRISQKLDSSHRSRG